MKNTFRHTGVLFMAAVVGLAVIGAGYALWFQVLTLNASVTTGTLDVEWSDEGTARIYSTTLGDTFVEEFLDLEAQTPNPDFILGKVENLTCDQAISDDGHTMTVTDTGLYPYAGCLHVIDIHNSGTVPVHIDLDTVEVTNFDCTPDPDCSEDDLTTELDGCELEMRPESTVPPTLDLEENIVQLHPSNEIVCAIRVYANQSAPENATYTADVQVLACQWNEDVNCTFENIGDATSNDPTPTPTPLP
jgi:hypothetical protein